MQNEIQRLLRAPYASRFRASKPACKFHLCAKQKCKENVTANNKITDKNPSFIHAVNIINRSRPSNPVSHKIVVGLQNLDPQSKEFRPFKQIIERFNRTYNYHIKSAHGFNVFNGAVSLTTLFVTHYNFLRPHMALDYSVPIPLEQLNYIPTIQGQWAKILEVASKL